MRLILCDPKAELCEAWKQYFSETDVQIHNSCFEDVTEYDCMVSPANSFGLMDGGIDAAIIRYFGEGLVKKVQQHIIGNYCGEQPVGTSFIIETGHDQHRYLAHTPTMRVPMIIANTDNVYNAMRAMLMAVKQQPDIKTVLCPGLGTLTGRVPFDWAARQMYLAYMSIMKPIKEISWQVASETENQLRRG